MPVTLSGVNLTFVAIVGVIAVIALVMAMVFRREVLAASDGTTNMQAIALAVQEGASAYLTPAVPHAQRLRRGRLLPLLLLPVHASDEFGDLDPEDLRSVAFLAGCRLFGPDRLPGHVARGPRQCPGGLGGPQ